MQEVETLSLRTAGGGPVSTYNTSADASGYFTVTAPTFGNYIYWVKDPQTLANSNFATLVEGGVNTVEMGILREGDANDDNCVTLTDFNILKNTFGRTSGDPGYDGQADFNGDDTISLADFNLLKGNFGSCGADTLSLVSAHSARR